MNDQLRQLKEIQAEVIDLNYVSALLGWDQQTYMPRGGAGERGDQMATIARLAHQRATSPEVGRLVEALAARLDGMDPDSDDACLVRRAYEDFKKQSRVPTQLVAEYAQATTTAQAAWVQARSESSFALFRPALERVVDLRRQYAACFQPYEHIYDPLLDDFERGLKTAQVQSIFRQLRPQQVALVKTIGEQPQVDDSFLHLEYPAQAQWDFGVEVITRFGYDWNRGRQDFSAHPFTQSFGLDDVRLTTRIEPNLVASGLFSTLHECGHGLYEQGFSPALRRTLLATAASLGVHESQSRMWENLVGRSLPFWKFFYPRLQQAFPAQLGNVDLMSFYRGINRVEPSLVRVEADEATYNLHIMLRLELEIALMEGSLEVKDLPEAWSARMQDYLGITPPDDSLGVLQDIHWSMGLIGYFPTYALGNLISAQLWERIHQDITNLEEQIEQGQFSALLEWLREKIHRHGAKYEPQALVRQVTGSGIDPQPYLRYLTGKYGEIYQL